MVEVVLVVDDGGELVDGWVRGLYPGCSSNIDISTIPVKTGPVN